MRSRLGSVLLTVVTVTVGFITLVGLLIGPELEAVWNGLNDLTARIAPGSGNVPFLAIFAHFFVQVAVLIVALMMILGLVNLLSVHTTKLLSRNGRFSWVFSLVFLITFGGTVGLYIVERGTNTPSAQSPSRMLLEQIQIAIESSLAALLFFSLVYGASRILRTDVSLYRLLFVAMIIFVLVAALPFAQLDVVRPFYNWMLLVPVNAGARGLLIGIGLATALTGLRVLIGQDKTYH